MRFTEDGKGLLLAFGVGTLIRSVPNLVTPYPIGFDTIYYAIQILDWRSSLANPNVVFQTPLHLLILGPVYGLTGLDPFVILRVVQPLLYGVLVMSFLYAARNLLGWELRRAFLAALIFSLQTAMLRDGVRVESCVGGWRHGFRLSYRYI